MFNNKDEKKQLVLPDGYDEITGNFGCNLIIKRNNLYGMIANKGKEILKPIYKNIIPVNDCTFVVQNENHFAIFYHFTLLPTTFDSKDEALKIAEAYI